MAGFEIRIRWLDLDSCLIMIGIIYKFTIIAKYKMDGYHPFYIGQHWCKSKEDFLNRDYPYYGSGSIWNDFLSKLKKDYPNRWRYFIRREILCCVTKRDSQSTLNKLEKYWIEREHSHYSLGLGGCNVIIGSSYDTPPSTDILVRKKIAEWNIGRKHSDNSKRKISNSLNIYYKTHAGGMKGKHHTEEQKRKWSENRKGKQTGEDNPFYRKTHTQASLIKMSAANKGCRWITNGIVDKKIFMNDEMPDGFRYGRSAKMSEEARKRLSIANSGSNNFNIKRKKVS